MIELHNHNFNSFLGTGMQQSWADIAVWEKVLAVVEPDVVIEIGTNLGGLSAFFLLQSQQYGFKFHTYDVVRKPGLVLKLGEIDIEPHFRQLDILSEKGIGEIEALIAQDARVLLLCDGGNKSREFKTFAPAMKPGDCIAVHDWDIEIDAEKVRGVEAQHNLTRMFWQECEEVGSVLRFWKTEPPQPAVWTKPKAIEKVFFYAPNRIEPWSYKNLETGIGGSETSQIELSWRLAEMGHDVTSYTALPNGDEGTWRGVNWRDLEEADLNEPGLWIVYRSPTTFTEFEPSADRRAWLVCQDVYYPDWTEEVVKADRIMALCTTHRSYLLDRSPEILNKLVMSSNGVRVDVIEDLEPVERNPKRLIYSSSPDRGLDSLLKIFERAREYVDDLELHIFYGIDNIQMISDTHGDRRPWQPSFDTMEKAKGMEGVTWHGRTGQGELYSEFMKSALWVYPTDFTETSCISCMEAQCMGAIPITRPYWATLDNVKHGVFIEGSPAGDALVRAKYVDAIVSVASNPAQQEVIRQPMMEEARQRLDWWRVAEQWDGWIKEYREEKPVERMDLYGLKVSRDATR